MPLNKINTSGQQRGWGVWFIGETRDELAALVTEVLPADIVHAQKQLEWLAARALMQRLTQALGVDYNGIVKDEFGKPFPKGYDYHISLTHSFPYVAIQIGSGQAVGIDLEQPKEKLLRIAPRILSDRELENAGSELQKHCVYWCGKEAMYKLHGKRGLHFKDQLTIAPFEMQQEGSLQGVITAEGEKQSVTLWYVVEKEYVMVLTETGL